MSSLTAPVVGVGTVVWKDDLVLLIRRGRPPRQGSWSLPGGRQELGETIEQTALREVREETGLTVRITDLVAVIDLIDREGDEIRYHYTVIDMMGEWLAGEALAGDDAEAVAWVHPSRLCDYAVTEEVLQVVAESAVKRARATGHPTAESD